MTDTLASFSIDVSANTAAAKSQILELEKLGARFSNRFAASFERAAFSGEGFGEVLRGLALDLSRLAFRSAFQPFQQAGAGVLGDLFQGLLGFAKGGVVGGPAPAAFARGGVMASPVMFPLGSGRAGLAGEAGPEAIIPLARGPDGRLGVRAQGAAGSPMSITFNITTQDAESFRRSEGQLAAMLARAAQRGQRNL